MALVLQTSAILIVFEKLTRACFFQIALDRLSGNNNKLYLPREKHLKDIGNKKQVPIHIILNSATVTE